MRTLLGRSSISFASKTRSPLGKYRSFATLGCLLVLLPAALWSESEGSQSPVGNPNGVLTAGLRGGSNGGLCNVPTDGGPSPLFGATDFSQPMLRFEQFGTRPMAGESAQGCSAATNCPEPLEPPGGHADPDPYVPLTATEPGGENFDEVIVEQGLVPYPTLAANQAVPNPWQSAIERTHTGTLEPLAPGMLSSFADGRPPGPHYAHQRYSEFYPTRYMKTGVSGSRINRGARDSAQSHGFSRGEFGPAGGLYHNTIHGPLAQVCGQITAQQACEEAANPETLATDTLCVWEAGKCSGRFDGTTAGIPIRFHPSMPVQDPQALWTFDGTLPPKLLKVRYAEPLLFRNYNGLPIKFEGNRGFGSHFMTTHLHNGHVPAESDGYAEAYFLPGQFYDYHWPVISAGHDSINPDAADPRASTPCEPGESLEISYPSPERDAGGRLCDRSAKLSENGTREDSGGYADPGACGWRKEVRLCPAAGTPGAGRIRMPGDWREMVSTQWFHDHMIDYTAQNVYKGNAAMMNYYSGVDRGNECLDDGVNLRFPSGCGPSSSGEDYSWGNRDYDINLLIASKAWGQDERRYPGTAVDDTRGQLWYAIFNTDGFLGDRMTVNWLHKPYFNVRARSYRLRILNGDISRFMTLALVVKRNDMKGEFAGSEPSTSYDRVPMYLIANDGNVMEHAVPFDGSMDLDDDAEFQDHNGILPTLSIAERYDVIADFGKYAPGSRLYMVNLLQHEDGRGPDDLIDLDEVLAGDYDGCDPAVGKFLEFRVHPYAGVDRSMDPRRYVPGNSNGPDGEPLKMSPLPEIDEEELLNAHHRTFEFGRGAGTDRDPTTITKVSFTSAAPAPSLSGEFDYEVYAQEAGASSVAAAEDEELPFEIDKPWGIETDGGESLSGDFHYVTSAPKLGDLEVWHLINGGGGWSHNIHIHFEEGRILSRDGKVPPEWEKWARKDVYRLGRMDDSGSEITLAMRFREFAGSYMEHCHNTQHEDHAMLMRWDIENPGQLKPFLLPQNQWNGCTYTESVELLSASAQRSSEVGNPVAKAVYELEHDYESLLCPPGAAAGCPGSDTGFGLLSPDSVGNEEGAGPEGLSSHPSPPVASTLPHEEGEEEVGEAENPEPSAREIRRAARDGERKARREARREARKAERSGRDTSRLTERATDAQARAEVRAERDRAREAERAQRRAGRVGSSRP